jgi:hypothetical protein
MSNILSATNTLILLITAVIVYWYTKAAQKTNEMAERPVLHLTFNERDVGGARQGDIKLQNIGKGIAHEIRIEKMQLLQNGRGECVVSFYTENPILQPDEVVTLKNTTRVPGGGTEAHDDGLMWFIIRAIPETLLQREHDKQRNKYPAIFCIHYKDINGISYYSVYDFYSTSSTVGTIILQLVKFGRGSIRYRKAKSLAKKIERFKSPFYTHINQTEQFKDWCSIKWNTIKSLFSKD